MQERKIMKPSNLILRCYAERERDGSWFAICLDLNITAQADTAKEAKEKLHMQIIRYVREALTVDKQYIESLMPRRAPTAFFLRYYFLRLLCALRGRHQPKRDAKRIFNEHLPVVPA